MYQELEDNRTYVAGGLEESASSNGGCPQVQHAKALMRTDYCLGLDCFRSFTELCLRKDWANHLDDDSANNTSITTFNLTIGSDDESYLREHCAKDLAHALAKDTSITTFNLTINIYGKSYLNKDWAKGLGDGLARNTSITTLSLTINSNDESYLRKDWAKGLGDGLARNTSITTLSLTINSNSRSYLSEDWAKGLVDGLARNTSITNLSISEDWVKSLGNGLEKNTSLRAATVIVNGNRYSGQELTNCLGHSLSKSSSSPLAVFERATAVWQSDSKLLKSRNWRIAADLVERDFIPLSFSTFNSHTST